MITRRAFLIGSGGLLTAGLVLKYETYLENVGRPLIQTPKRPHDVLYVYPDNEYQICLGPNPLEPRVPTWREALRRYADLDVDWTKPLQAADYREIHEEYCIRPDQLDDEADWDWYVRIWGITDSPNANAYHLLEDLDIGPELAGENGELGGIKFIEGSCPGVDYLGVHCEDELSISLLQAKLNELDTGLALRVAYDSDRT